MLFQRMRMVMHAFRNGADVRPIRQFTILLWPTLVVSNREDRVEEDFVIPAGRKEHQVALHELVGQAPPPFSAIIEIHPRTEDQRVHVGDGIAIMIWELWDDRLAVRA